MVNDYSYSQCFKLKGYDVLQIILHYIWMYMKEFAPSVYTLPHSVCVYLSSGALYFANHILDAMVIINTISRVQNIWQSLFILITGHTEPLCVRNISILGYVQSDAKIDSNVLILNDCFDYIC